MSKSIEYTCKKVVGKIKSMLYDQEEGNYKDGISIIEKLPY